MTTSRKLITGLRQPGYVGWSRDSVVASEADQKISKNLPRKTLPTPPPLPREGVGGGLRAAGPGGMPAPMREGAPACASQVEAILEQAKALTAKQRQELLDQLSLANQMSRSAGDDRDLDMWATAVYSALTDRASSSASSGFGQLLVKRALAPTQNWRPVQSFMEESRLCELKVVERASVYHMLAELLVDHAQIVADRSGAPLGPKLVGSCAAGIAGVFDKAFPGYLRAGLAKVAARQLISHRA